MHMQCGFKKCIYSFGKLGKVAERLGESWSVWVSLTITMTNTPQNIGKASSESLKSGFLAASRFSNWKISEVKFQWKQ